MISENYSGLGLMMQVMISSLMFLCTSHLMFNLYFLPSHTSVEEKAPQTALCSVLGLNTSRKKTFITTARAAFYMLLLFALLFCFVWYGSVCVFLLLSFLFVFFCWWWLVGFVSLLACLFCVCVCCLLFLVFFSPQGKKIYIYLTATEIKSVIIDSGHLNLILQNIEQTGLIPAIHIHTWLTSNIFINIGFKESFSLLVNIY